MSWRYQPVVKWWVTRHAKGWVKVLGLDCSAGASVFSILVSRKKGEQKAHHHYLQCQRRINQVIGLFGSPWPRNNNSF